MAWVKQSASEWPSRPKVALETHAAEHERAARGGAVNVIAVADAEALGISC